MSLKTAPRPLQPRAPEVRPPGFPEGGEPEPQETPTVRVERSVLVSHGIHRGYFPVAGMRIRDARQTLTRLLNIDPEAAPVINGRVVSEDEVIAEGLALLSFVKPSSLKG